MEAAAVSTFCISVMGSTAIAEDIQTRRVSFENRGATLAGTLYLPPDYQPGERRPGVVVSGAWTSIKEQMSGLYAREMAERGFAALAFDHRGWGQSGGETRFKEDPAEKTSDIAAAAAFMATLPEVDAVNINGLGICASAGYMAAAATGNANFAAVALVAPWLHNRQIVEQVYGGREGVSKLIATSREAETSEGRGQPRTITAASMTDQTSLMYQIPYYTEADRGLIPQYDNRFNLASWEPWLTYDSVSLGAKLDKPTLIVHSEGAAVLQGAHAFYALLPGEKSELWLDDVSQFDFYDRPEPVTIAADAAAAHFTRANASQQIAPQDRAAIIDTITDIAAGADRHQWDRVRRAFADEVTLDYTSLWGGTPTTQAADDIIRQWSGFLPGFDETQHLVTNHAITSLEGAKATAEADFQATHRIGTDLWVLTGHYRYELIKVNAAWKVSALTMTATHETGDRGLAARAAERAPKIR
ncbi:Alpha/beta hydrolase family protein [Neorhizobium galegae bv. officinalis]|uniref:Alpha/beta hydrolase family protein n=1 Tax=Neorhizobium galegae bv. officinalis TaxID=323656 RepID=A0A0T7FMB4_NEOGA|nr:nuclear transport factor 2 family protein [Neorhizobium galegae]CDZ36170.1 Alpha/beta hydrolase family protein [Neorhizobium galegae bv. officinalis]